MGSSMAVTVGDVAATSSIGVKYRQGASNSVVSSRTFRRIRNNRIRHFQGERPCLLESSKVLQRCLN